MKKGLGDKVLGWFIVDEEANANARVSFPVSVT